MAILQFPRTRDRRFVERQARVMASYSPEGAERHLRSQMELQARTMASRGIAPAIITEHIQALEGAIRVALWGQVLTPGDAA